MEDPKFQEIAKKGIDMLRAALSGIAPGETIAYNAYWRGQEVVVLGYQPDARTTKPLAILVDPEIFDSLRVDQESGRWDGDGEQKPPQVV